MSPSARDSTIRQRHSRTCLQFWTPARAWPMKTLALRYRSLSSRRIWPYRRRGFTALNLWIHLRRLWLRLTAVVREKSLCADLLWMIRFHREEAMMTLLTWAALWVVLNWHRRYRLERVGPPLKICGHLTNPWRLQARVYRLLSQSWPRCYTCSNRTAQIPSGKSQNWKHLLQSSKP